MTRYNEPITGMSLRTELTVEIASPPDRIWDVLMDVEKWHEWTASILSIQRLDPGLLIVGSRARIRQPGLAAMIWRVTRLAPGSSFTWETRNWGVLTVAEHEITPTEASRCTVVLRVRQSGLLVPILRRWIARLTRRNVELEAQGLKRRCEEAT